MTSLPKKIPLSSILLNPDINNLNNDTIHSNLPPSQHDNISYSSENSYINNNDNSNIDYVTRYPIQEMICNSKIR